MSKSNETCPLFDTHAHLDDERFDENRATVIENAVAAGVTNIVCIGTTVETSAKCISIAKEYPIVHAAVGIQPNCCAEVKPGDWERIVDMARSGDAIAIGETGLDRYWDDCPFEIQQDYFDRHLALSKETGLPFVVHMRDCQADVLEMLQAASLRGPLNGLMHSYTGDANGARECLDLGLYISFAGMVTYKKSDELRQVAAAIPADRILIETDSPYLSPHPKRSVRPNEPALVRHTAECLADVRQAPLAEFCRQTHENAMRLFRLQ
ncbi:MAG: TatD family hydrolase [Planctomycetales bacterium]|nr:TatD family hydrolase [Planctomycetales bacterium]